MNRLFDPEPHAVARRTDPWSSHEAAASVTKVRESQKAVLEALTILGPMTDEELAHQYGGTPQQSPSGLRTRRSELVELGKVRDSGQRRVLRSGRRAIVWEAL